MPPVETTVVLTATIPAGLPANQKVVGELQLDPALGAQTQLQVPQTESWVIEDLYVSAEQGIDCIVELKKNLRDTIGRTAPINSLLISNPSRPRIKPVMLARGDILTVEVQNLTAGGESDTDITTYLKLVRFVR